MQTITHHPSQFQKSICSHAILFLQVYETYHCTFWRLFWQWGVTCGANRVTHDVTVYT